jgi:hypothetical protein
LADDRQAQLLLVRLECDLEELCRRIGAPERRNRMKWTDPEALRQHFAKHRILDPPDGVECLTLDTTATPPRAAVDEIIARLDRSHVTRAAPIAAPGSPLSP